MKAAVVNEFKNTLEIKEVPKPTLEFGEVLVKIEACGVCHTDLHAAHGDWPVKPKLPLIPGHEGVGIVEEVADGVTNVKIGDRVGIPWLYSACGECEYCLTGRETLCPDQLNGGYSVDGGYAEYCKAPAAYVAKIPDNVDPVEIAPILCAGVTTYKALKVSEAKPGDWVAIYGIGGLGHVALQYAKAMGFNVVAVDIADEKLDLAKNLGAGLPHDDLPIPIFDTVLNGVTVRGSIVGTRKDMQEALEFAAQGKVKTIIESTPLDSVNEVFDKMEKGQINGRIVLKM